MSTDFSLDALLNGSSVISPPNKKQTPLSTATASPDATAAQLLSRISATLPTPPADQETSAGEKKRRNNKRKREEEDDDDKQKDISQPEPKKKRVRTAYTRQQLKRLEYMFAQNQYPDMLMRENIAEELGLPDQKIHVSLKSIAILTILAIQCMCMLTLCYSRLIYAHTGLVSKQTR